MTAANWPALLKSEEAAEYLSVSIDTVNKLTRARELRKITLPGTTAARYSRLELDAAIERWGRRAS